MNAAPRDLPVYPFTDEADERTEGVLLLEHDDESKVTANSVPGGWHVVNWEVTDWDGADCWFARWTYSIPSTYLVTLAAHEASK